MTRPARLPDRVLVCAECAEETCLSKPVGCTGGNGARGKHVLAARSDASVPVRTPEGGKRRARALWALDTFREHMANDELEALVAAGNGILAGRR